MDEDNAEAVAALREGLAGWRETLRAETAAMREAMGAGFAGLHGGLARIDHRLDRLAGKIREVASIRRATGEMLARWEQAAMTANPAEQLPAPT